jgi:hypothetical protein
VQRGRGGTGRATYDPIIIIIYKSLSLSRQFVSRLVDKLTLFTHPRSTVSDTFLGCVSNSISRENLIFSVLRHRPHHMGPKISHLCPSSLDIPNKQIARLQPSAHITCHSAPKPVCKVIFAPDLRHARLAHKARASYRVKRTPQVASLPIQPSRLCGWSRRSPIRFLSSFPLLFRLFLSKARVTARSPCLFRWFHSVCFECRFSLFFYRNQSAKLREGGARRKWHRR